jgi:hypothetical protein
MHLRLGFYHAVDFVLGFQLKVVCLCLVSSGFIRKVPWLGFVCVFLF